MNNYVYTVYVEEVYSILPGRMLPPIFSSKKLAIEFAEKELPCMSNILREGTSNVIRIHKWQVNQFFVPTSEIVDEWVHIKHS